MLTVACVLRSGGIYTPDWVARLRTGVSAHLSLPHRFVCLSDVDVPCERIPLQHDWPGWWAKMELFDLPGPLLYLDLDTLVVGDLEDIAAVAQCSCFVMLRDFYRPNGLGSGVMAWGMSVAPPVGLVFGGAPAVFMQEHAQGGDQEFVEWLGLGSVDRWQSLLPGQIVSYKADGCERAAPANARLMCLHGRPKFADMPASSWARQAWERLAA